GALVLRRLGHPVRPAGAGPHPGRRADADRLRIRLRAAGLRARQAHDDVLHGGVPYVCSDGPSDGHRRLDHAAAAGRGAAQGATDMSISLATTPVPRFQISLNIPDLERSVSFYKVLFNMEPAKRRPDYAKFEPNDPPLVLSLEPNGRSGGGTLNHLGIRLP